MNGLNGLIHYSNNKDIETYLEVFLSQSSNDLMHLYTDINDIVGTDDIDTATAVSAVAIKR